MSMMLVLLPAAGRVLLPVPLLQLDKIQNVDKLQINDTICGIL